MPELEELEQAKPAYSEWMRTLKAKAVEAQKEEEEERRWREAYGR
jgi:hypothetical protein